MKSLSINAHAILFVCLSFLWQTAQAQSWERVNEIPSIQISALHTSGNLLFAAAPNRLYITYDGGLHWDSTAIIDAQIDFIEAVVFTQNRLYVGTVVDGVYRSDDGGQTWLADNVGLSGLGAKAIRRFTIRGDSLYVATGGAGVFVKKISNNSTWSSFNQGLPWHNVESITNIDGKLFAGAGGNATFSLRESSSQAWAEKQFDEFDGSVNFFLGIQKAGDILLAAGTNGLYRSEDGGGSWEFYNPGTGVLGSASFVSIGERVYVNLAKPVGFSFIKYTDDDGLTWKTFEPELTGSFGFNIAKINDQIYSSRSNGLWRLESATPVKQQEAFAAFEQGFPNPFSGETKIPVILAKDTWMELSVFDAKGLKVAKIWEGVKPAGKYEFTFDGANLPEGMYYFRLKTEMEILSQSMVKINQ